MRLLVCFFICLLFTIPLHAQYADYQYKRDVQGIEGGGWYRIPIPQDMYVRLRDDMNDLRLMRLSTDSVDTPFLIHSDGYSKSWAGVAVKEVNNKDQKYVFRYEGDVQPNTIRVDVDQRNYDVEFSLEGSNNRLIWDPVASGIRMMGVVERDLSYGMNEAEFPGGDYTFYRLVWNDPEIDVEGVALGKVEVEEGVYQPVGLRDWSIETDTDKHLSVISIDLPAKIPVSKVQLQIEGADGEYVRTVDARYVRQTITENDGTERYLWRDWDRKVLSSFEEPVFYYDEVRTDHIELTVYDQDELPLAIRGVQVFGLAYEIRAMCSGDGAYEVIYGSEASRPASTSRTRPPSAIRTASLGPEQLIRPEEAGEEDSQSLFGGDSSGGSFFEEWKGFFIGFFVAFGAILLGRLFLKRKRKQD